MTHDVHACVVHLLTPSVDRSAGMLGHGACEVDVWLCACGGMHSLDGSRHARHGAWDSQQLDEDALLSTFRSIQQFVVGSYHAMARQSVGECLPRRAVPTLLGAALLLVDPDA